MTLPDYVEIDGIVQSLPSGGTFSNRDSDAPIRMADVRQAAIDILRAQLSHVRLELLKARINLDADYMPGMLRLQTTMRVLHRTTFAPVDVGAEKVIRADMTRAQMIECAKSYLLELLKHEVDEMFYVAGLGPDPHGPAPVVIHHPDLGRVLR